MADVQLEYMVIDSFSFADRVSGLYDRLYNVTGSIEETYPSHRSWFYTYFIGELLKNDKALIVFARNKSNGEMAGVAFLNTEIGKLNTLFVNPEYRRRGIANTLLELAETKMGIRPMVTVSEENLTQLQSLFDKRGYRLSYKVIGYYREGKCEFCFNDDSREKVLYNPREFFDCVVLSGDVVPTFITKPGKDYQNLFGRLYSSRLKSSSGRLMEIPDNK